MIAKPESFNGAPSGKSMKENGFQLGFPEEDIARVGLSLGSTKIDITSARVADYMERTGDDNTDVNKKRIYEKFAPATLFPNHSSIEMSWFLPNMHGNLHAQQEWYFYNAIPIGVNVLATRTIVDRYNKRGRTYVVCESSFSDENGGKLYARSLQHQSFLEDQSKNAVDAWKTGTSKKTSGTVIKKVRKEIITPDNDGGEYVEKFGPITRQASVALCEKYAGAPTGKGFGNGHLDTDEADGMGFPGIVVVGTLSVCFLSELLTKRFGLGYLEGGSLDIKFTRPLWLGCTVEAYGIIRNYEQHGERKKAICEVWCKSSDGSVTIVGTASAFEQNNLGKL